MKIISGAALPFSALQNDLLVKLFSGAGLVAFADWLLYDHRPGVSLAILLLAIAIAAFVTNPLVPGTRRIVISASLLLAGLAPIVEEFNFLSATIGIIATAVAVASLTNPFIETLGDRLTAARQILLSGPFRLFADLSVLRSRSWSLTQISVWIVPLVLSVIFIALFSEANPLIEHWFALIEFGALFANLNAWRIAFWIAILCAIWPFISARWTARKAAERAETTADTPRGDVIDNAIFGAPAILRSLILFNLLFAVESVLDLVYLWGGVALPNGMTYASYAHRGAYPLMITALLAAAFVLAAMRAGGPAERVPVIRTLVFLWVAQNVLLVISSILRLDLYVEIYSLTYWRVAAFVWMILVALGLVLIVTRIALNRSNWWLVNANLMALMAALYICALVNFPLLIANYNVSHSKEVSGKGTWLDFGYLASLGPHAVPALDRYRNHPNKIEPFRSVSGPNGERTPTIDNVRYELVNNWRAQQESWRAWSFRDWRLQQYLDRISTNSGVTP